MTEVFPAPAANASMDGMVLLGGGSFAMGSEDAWAYPHDGESSVFTGTVNWVQIDLGEDAEDADHLITPEERLRVAMARQ